jgi:hypothetical protein
MRNSENDLESLFLDGHDLGRVRANDAEAENASNPASVGTFTKPMVANGALASDTRTQTVGRHLTQLPCPTARGRREIGRRTTAIRYQVDTLSRVAVMKSATVIKPIRLQLALGESVRPPGAASIMEGLNGKVVHETQHFGDPFDPPRSRVRRDERAG